MRCIRRWWALLLVAGASLLAACGDGGSGGGARMNSGAAPDAETATSWSSGELRIGADFLPVNLDPTKAFNLQRFGIGETLTRLTTDLKPEPWLAQEKTNVSPTTWMVRLRPHVMFPDGSPMDAEAVAASFRRIWESNASATSLISKETRVTAVLGPSFRNLLIALVFTNWPWYARAYRSIILKERAAPYVKGATALGAGHWRVVGRHILPNAIGPAVVPATPCAMRWIQGVRCWVLGIGCQFSAESVA